MVKARALSANRWSPKRRAWETPYIWNERPGWDYAGKPRVIWGHEVDARSFSIRTNSAKGIIWTVERQCWAVEQGFFVQRELIRERPVIIGLTQRFDKDAPFSYFEPYRTMREIERRVFRCEPGYGILLDFIQQQDLYGFTGAWDRKVMNYSPMLEWYKMLKRPLHYTAQRKAALQANAAKARERKYLNRVRDLIKHGHKPGKHKASTSMSWPGA